MKNKILTIGLLLLLPVVTLAQGASTAGNGGDAVIFPDGRIEMLDTVDRFPRTQIMQPENARTVREILNVYLERLRNKFDPRGYEYQSLADLMLTDIEAAAGREVYYGRIIQFDEDDLSDIPDSLEESLPAGSVKRQLIIQRRNQPDKQLLHIDTKIWNRMTPLAQAIGIMHELVYKEMLDRGQKDSIFTRQLNWAIVSNEIETLYNPCSWAQYALNNRLQLPMLGKQKPVCDLQSNEIIITVGLDSSHALMGSSYITVNAEQYFLFRLDMKTAKFKRLEIKVSSPRMWHRPEGSKCDDFGRDAQACKFSGVIYQGRIINSAGLNSELQRSLISLDESYSTEIQFLYHSYKKVSAAPLYLLHLAQPFYGSMAWAMAHAYRDGIDGAVLNPLNGKVKRVIDNTKRYRNTKIDLMLNVTYKANLKLIYEKLLKGVQLDGSETEYVFQD